MIFVVYRRVHITLATKEQLDGKFQTEPGNGQSRDPYIADHRVETYMIIPPKVSESRPMVIELFFIFFQSPD